VGGGEGLIRRLTKIGRVYSSTANNRWKHFGLTARGNDSNRSYPHTICDNLYSAVMTVMEKLSHNDTVRILVAVLASPPNTCHYRLEHTDDALFYINVEDKRFLLLV